MSKKRIRKNGKPAVYRKRSLRIGTSPQTIADMEQLFRNLELSVQMRLPIGIADVDDICIIRDFINLTQIGYITRGDRTDEEIADVIPWLGHCGDTLMTLANRYKRINKVLCTGDELCEIRDVVTQISPYLQDSIQYCPDTLMTEWMLMDKYNKADKDSVISVQELSIKKIRTDLEAIKASRAFYHADPIRMTIGA